jgi:hypothetical protein
MKTTSIFAAFLAGNAAAFPTMDMFTGPLAAEAQRMKRQIDASAPQGAGALPLVAPAFDAKTQHISTTGKYKVGG